MGQGQGWRTEISQSELGSAALVSATISGLRVGLSQTVSEHRTPGSPPGRRGSYGRVQTSFGCHAAGDCGPMVSAKPRKVRTKFARGLGELPGATPHPPQGQARRGLLSAPSPQPRGRTDARPEFAGRAEGDNGETHADVRVSWPDCAGQANTLGAASRPRAVGVRAPHTRRQGRPTISGNDSHA